MRLSFFKLLIHFGFLSALLLSCTKTPPPSSQNSPSAQSNPVDLIAHGRKTYISNCIACHNINPTLDGNVGPAIAGSSHDLIQARVTKGQYPTGYQAKRQTHLMQPIPGLENEIDALSAYLASVH
jgi:mono/diheme cytochrome c family protein